MPAELTLDQAVQMLPDRKMHVIESVGITRLAGEWTHGEVWGLLQKAERIERRAGTDDPYGHELAILALGRWFFVAT